MYSMQALFSNLTANDLGLSPYMIHITNGNPENTTVEYNTMLFFS